MLGTTGLVALAGLMLVVEAGSSVADEKVTVLCEKRALREVMRQLARPFGYTWLRSGKAGAYRCELVQDLRSQLVEEELRNRDRGEALLALDREMQRYHPSWRSRPMRRWPAPRRRRRPKRSCWKTLPDAAGERSRCISGSPRARWRRCGPGGDWTSRRSQDKDGGWLQFRSVSYYDDRLKEIPNRQLARWAASRHEKGALPLDDLIEIAQLTDVQLDSPTMAEGARDGFGLPEWDLAREGNLRHHLRYLATVQARTREAALEAARCIDPAVDPAQVVPARLSLAVVYLLTDKTTGALRPLGVRGSVNGARISW